MNTVDAYHFNQLKSAVIAKFLAHQSAPSAVKDWDGQTIVLFQEDLFNTVKGNVSEKWFYTYFKNDAAKLPRIDMLNLLSNYVGFKNWNAFRASKPFNSKRLKAKSWYWLFLLVPFTVISILAMNSKNSFQFCFIDNLSNVPITQIALDIKILKDQQSPIYFKTDSLGCFNYDTKDEKITFVVSSPNHKTDTITRTIDANEHKVVKLNSDDYALILKYYANGNVKDWSQHKRKLEALIKDDAQIYRIYNASIGVEIYSKDDFIRLLTIPTKTLKEFTILDKHHENGQITMLKFTVK